MIRDLRELWGREGGAGVIGLGLVIYWSVECEYQIVRYGLNALRSLRALAA